MTGKRDARLDVETLARGEIEDVTIFRKSSGAWVVKEATRGRRSGRGGRDGRAEKN